MFYGRCWATNSFTHCLAFTFLKENLISYDCEYCDENFFSYDYENCDASGANLMMTFIESQMPAFIGQKFTANEKSFLVTQADNFTYTDPVDGSVSKKQVVTYAYLFIDLFIYFLLHLTNSASMIVKKEDGHSFLLSIYRIRQMSLR